MLYLTVKEEEAAGGFGTLFLGDDEHIIGTFLDQERFEVAAQGELDRRRVDDTDDVSSSRRFDDGKERTFGTVLCDTGKRKREGRKGKEGTKCVRVRDSRGVEGGGWMKQNIKHNSKQETSSAKDKERREQNVPV